MTVDDILRLLLPVKIKMQTMIGRAVLLAVDNSGKAQFVRVKLNGDEIIEQIERIQEYGLETNPPVEDTGEVVIFSVGGSRDLSFVTKTQVRDLRPAGGVTSGEVQLWSKFGQKIYLKADGSVLIEAVGKDVNVTCKDVTVTATGNIKLGGSGAVGKIVTTESTCAYTGGPHPDGCEKVFAKK